MAERTHDRLAINAAIDYLRRGEQEHWLDAANMIIAFGSQLPVTYHRDFIHTSCIQSGGVNEGVAAGVGVVMIADEPKRTLKQSEPFAKVERIGNYKLYHQRLRKASFIACRHWRDDFRVFTADVIEELWVVFFGNAVTVVVAEWHRKPASEVPWRMLPRRMLMSLLSKGTIALLYLAALRALISGRVPTWPKGNHSMSYTFHAMPVRVTHTTETE